MVWRPYVHAHAHKRRHCASFARWRERIVCPNSIERDGFTFPLCPLLPPPPPTPPPHTIFRHSFAQCVCLVGVSLSSCRRRGTRRRSVTGTAAQRVGRSATQIFTVVACVACVCACPHISQPCSGRSKRLARCACAVLYIRVGLSCVFFGAIVCESLIFHFIRVSHCSGFACVCVCVCCVSVRDRSVILTTSLCTYHQFTFVHCAE